MPELRVLPVEGLPEIGEGDGLARLDAGKFRPALVIPQRKIIGSPLTPDTDHPTRGFAEVWRANIHVIGTDQATVDRVSAGFLAARRWEIQP